MAHFTINHLYKVQVSEKTQFDLAEVERRTKRTLDALMHCKKKQKKKQRKFEQIILCLSSLIYLFFFKILLN